MARQEAIDRASERSRKPVSEWGTTARTCKRCGKEFKAYLSTVAKPGKGKFCGKACYSGTPTQRLAKMTNFEGPELRPGLGKCHIFTGNRNDRGYGLIKFEGKMVLAHRLAYYLAKGEWPMPLCLHSCDGGRHGCIRVEHLRAGTAEENSADYAERGDHSVRQGERNGLSKLTERAVQDILTQMANGSSLRPLAEKYGVKICVISSVWRGRSWRHVPGVRASGVVL